MTSTIGGTTTLGETWSVGASLGFALGKLQIGGSVDWSRSISLEWMQQLEIDIPPGQMVRRERGC